MKKDFRGLERRIISKKEKVQLVSFMTKVIIITKKYTLYFNSFVDINLIRFRELIENKKGVEVQVEEKADNRVFEVTLNGRKEVVEYIEKIFREFNLID